VLYEAKNVGIAQAAARLFNEVQGKITKATVQLIIIGLLRASCSKSIPYFFYVKKFAKLWNGIDFK